MGEKEFKKGEKVIANFSNYAGVYCFKVGVILKEVNQGILEIVCEDTLNEMAKSLQKHGVSNISPIDAVSGEKVRWDYVLHFTEKLWEEIDKLQTNVKDCKDRLSEILFYHKKDG